MSLYARIESGQVAAYPFNAVDLRIANPNTSFPAEMPDATLAEWGVFPVARTEPPAYDPATHRLQEERPVQSGIGWVQAWTLVPLTPEELVVRYQQKADAVRSEREALLTACDWTQLDDTPIANTQKQAWASYRQALRDVPSQAGFPFNVVWPAKP